VELYSEKAKKRRLTIRRLHFHSYNVPFWSSSSPTDSNLFEVSMNIKDWKQFSDAVDA
jgi:hypothetical protein